MGPSPRFLDLADPAFDVTGPEVINAREEGVWARTSYGYALLRHAEVTALLKDRRFRQGNARWPAQNGIHSGMFSDWWKRTLLSLEGQEHLRLRRLLNPAFKQGVVAAMVPGFAELAHELVDGFCEVDHDEVWLHNVHIPEYSQGTWTNHAARRKRKLLLHRGEIDKIARRVDEKGYTLVPLSIYFKDGRAKVEIALAKGKKQWDKRNAIAERTANREKEIEMGRRLKGMR